MKNLRRAIFIGGVLSAGVVNAHSFGQNYILPVPIWLYLYGSAAALIASFIIVSYIVSSPTVSGQRSVLEPETRSLHGAKWLRWPLRVLRCTSVLCLLLAIIAGFIGVNDPYRNINMTLFWIVFILGFSYLTALIGDLFHFISPWKVLTDWLQRFFPSLWQGRFTLSQRLGYWPALTLYMVFIWIELFGNIRPRELSALLTSYTLLNFVGCWLWGREDWFERCEFFGLFLRLVAKIAPVKYHIEEKTGRPAFYLRLPFSELLGKLHCNSSLLLFILFMLSSTAFDGIKETLPWVELFWKDLYKAVLYPMLGVEFYKSYPTLLNIYLAYQTLALILSPLFYLGVFVFFLWLSRLAAGNKTIPLKNLALSFGYSLIPIAIVYHVSHYFTLVFTQGSQITRLISDPFGMGWNLFGTATWTDKLIPDMNIVWHTQVLLILFGHIASVYIAHIQALSVFPDRRQAVRSQLPMVFLILIFTTAGLWILALPASSGAPIG